MASELVAVENRLWATADPLWANTGTRELTVFGTEKASDTVKPAKMNLAVHGLSGGVREANIHCEDPHKAVSSNGGRFDFLMANPPFNVSGVDKGRLKDDPRFALGLPTTDNAVYLWIQLFAASLNDNGRARDLLLPKLISGELGVSTVPEPQALGA